MTENAPNQRGEALDPLSMAGLVDSSLRPGGSISLTFSDGIIHVMLDQTGDWTITAGLSILSDRMLQLSRSLEELGFFQATEQGGIAYHLWTSALEEHYDNRNRAE
ncbi:MAG TPA: hypothetical protein VNA15_10025, partial [Candidatus Angelobacter sp.]|nr:hypothetical protein [Candidatus Angelobacter sp.]